MLPPISRRAMLRGSVATAALFCARFPLTALAVDDPDPGVVLPFPEQTPTPSRPMVQWGQLASWITPLEEFFAVSHYGSPTLNAETWRLEVSGLVRKPLRLSLGDIKSHKSAEIIASLECSGNGASASFMGAVGNARWRGVPLHTVLHEAGMKSGGIEVVFYGADEKTEKIKDHDYQQNFARSLALSDAMDDRILLAYEMDGKPLPPEHGFPLRLIVPGWYGIAWVKWLTRIEIIDRRFMGRFMARDYVTIRGEDEHGVINWRETSVTRLNVKSIVSRVVRRSNGSLGIMAAAWTDGTPLKSVELKINDKTWIPMTLDKTHQAKYAWSFWTYEWRNPPAGDHTLVSRGIDAHGNIQPAFEDPAIKLKKTYYEANQQVPRTIKL